MSKEPALKPMKFQIIQFVKNISHSEKIGPVRNDVKLEICSLS